MKTAMSWYHLGLRGRLFMAFGVVAALTVLASSSAIISYNSLGHSLGEIADKSLPEITRASRVVRAAGEVAAAAPRLLAATDVAEREQLLLVKIHLDVVRGPSVGCRDRHARYRDQQRSDQIG